jgi:hypothetical protein
MRKYKLGVGLMSNVMKKIFGHDTDRMDNTDLSRVL